jgi:CheY-like chemotaxis protein
MSCCWSGRIVMTKATPRLNAPNASLRSAACFSVLIADEDQRFRDMVRRHLGCAARVVGEVSDGDEAVRVAKRLRPDVVLMDISMALVGGAEAARRIKDHRAETTVILLTSGAEQWEMTGADSRRIPALVLHADAFLRRDNLRVGSRSRPSLERQAGQARARRRRVRR